MSELTTTHQLVLYAVVIIVTMAMLDWLESRRARFARAPIASRAAEQTVRTNQRKLKSDHISMLLLEAGGDDDVAFLGKLTPSVLVALLVTGCGALAQSASPSAASPPLHRAPGGGYVPGDTTYHGSQGP